jgi:6-phosphofructokinase 2
MPRRTRALPALASPCSRGRAPPSSGEPVKPAVGAGDSMLAGIVLGLSRGLPLRDAVRFGMAAGAAALLGSGTQLCRHSDVERLHAGAEYLLDA